MLPGDKRVHKSFAVTIQLNSLSMLPCVPQRPPRDASLPPAFLRVLRVMLLFPPCVPQRPPRVLLLPCIPQPMWRKAPGLEAAWINHPWVAVTSKALRGDVDAELSGQPCQVPITQFKTKAISARRLKEFCARHCNACRLPDELPT
jgi:hypothetical protein